MLVSAEEANENIKVYGEGIHAGQVDSEFFGYCGDKPVSFFLAKAGLQYRPEGPNLVDAIWNDQRPKCSNATIYPLDMAFAGTIDHY